MGSCAYGHPPAPSLSSVGVGSGEKRRLQLLVPSLYPLQHANKKTAKNFFNNVPHEHQRQLSRGTKLTSLFRL